MFDLPVSPDDDTLPIEPVSDGREVVYLYQSVVSTADGALLADVSGVAEPYRSEILNDFVIELQQSGFAVIDRRPFVGEW